MRIAVGFDGASMYFVHPNGRRRLCPSFVDESLTDSWSNGAAFVPILQLEDWPQDGNPDAREATTTVTASVDPRFRIKVNSD